ncbi:uncharacterized protein LOC144558920 [Carex rostrata]
MRKLRNGKEYVTTRAQEAAEEFEKLKGIYGGKLEEDQIWEKAVKGEDSRGRLFGFGFRGRTSKSTRVPETVGMSPSGPTRSTATSAEDPNRPYTKEEVERMISEERTTFFEKFVAQDERHRAEMDRLIKLQESFEKFRACFELLFKQHNMRPPPFFNEPASEANTDGGNNAADGDNNAGDGDNNAAEGGNNGSEGGTNGGSDAF